MTVLEIYSKIKGMVGKISGKILINAYLKPVESVRQAKRLKEEFSKLSCDVEILSNGFLSSMISDGKIKSNLSTADFIIYLDKDKYLSNQLSAMPVRLFNSHESIRVCDDKGETYLALSKCGIPVPDTIFGALCYDKADKYPKDFLVEIGNRLKFPLVVKESFGSMGRGVYLANDLNELQGIAEKVKLKPHLFQKYLSYKVGTDIRVIVIGGKVIGAIKRSSETDFRSNVAVGGTATAINLDKDFIEIAEKTAKALSLDYCGIDILYGDNGEPVICEVNSNAFFEGMEKATGINVAKAYAEYVLSVVKK